MGLRKTFRACGLMLLLLSVLLGCEQTETETRHSKPHASVQVSEDPEGLEDRRRARILSMAENHSGGPDHGDGFNALDPLSTKGFVDGNSTYSETDDYWGLPREGAYELVAGYCSACHSLQIVMQQRASRERWRSMLKWMVEEQNMPPLDPQEYEQILDYLTEHF